MTDKERFFGVVIVLIILIFSAFYLGYNNGLHNGRVKQCNDMGQVLVLKGDPGEKTKLLCMFEEDIPKEDDFLNIKIDINEIGAK